MKKLIVVVVGTLMLSKAMADVDVSAGVKLYGVLDQAVQSQILSDPTGTTAGQKYVGMFAAASTSRLGVKASRELSTGTKAYVQVELELKPDKPKGGVINTSANRGTFVGLDGAAGTAVWARKKPWLMKHLRWMPMAAQNTSHSCGV
jgi:predicted porin